MVRAKHDDGPVVNQSICFHIVLKTISFTATLSCVRHLKKCHRRDMRQVLNKRESHFPNIWGGWRRLFDHHENPSWHHYSWIGSISVRMVCYSRHLQRCTKDGKCAWSCPSNQRILYAQSFSLPYNPLGCCCLRNLRISCALIKRLLSSDKFGFRWRTISSIGLDCSYYV